MSPHKWHLGELPGRITGLVDENEKLKAEVARLTKKLLDIKNLIELNGHKSLNEMVILQGLKGEQSPCVRCKHAYYVKDVGVCGLDKNELDGEDEYLQECEVARIKKGEQPAPQPLSALIPEKETALPLTDGQVNDLHSRIHLGKPAPQPDVRWFKILECKAGMDHVGLVGKLAGIDGNIITVLLPAGSSSMYCEATKVEEQPAPEVPDRPRFKPCTGVTPGVPPSDKGSGGDGKAGDPSRDYWRAEHDAQLEHDSGSDESSISERDEEGD